MAERTSIRCWGETRSARAGRPGPSAPGAITIGRSSGAAPSTWLESRRLPIQRSTCAPLPSVVTRSPTRSRSIRRGPVGVRISVPGVKQGTMP